MFLLWYLKALFTLNFWLSLLCVVILQNVVQMYVLRRRMPPGPLPWPLVGNFLTIYRTKLMLYELFRRLSKKYGDPITIFFGSKPFVILTKYELTKETLSQTTFSDRTDSYVFETLFDGQRTLSTGPYDSVHQVLRKIGGRSLRAIIDSESLSERVAGATDYTVKEMLKCGSGGVWPKAYMKNLIYNIVLAFAFGQTYEVNDPIFVRLLVESERGQKNFGKMFAFDFIPFVRYLPLSKFGIMREAKASVKVFLDYGRSQIDQHRKTFKDGVLRDLTDALITEQIQLAQENTGENISDTDVTNMINDFYTAGSETSSMTLGWFVLFMATHPEIQDECYRNIVEAIGDQEMRLIDRPKLAFVEACILETLRMRPPISLGLPRSPQCDTHIGDYFIPKGTFTLSSTFAMHMDPEYWTEPEKFDPRLHFIESSTGQLRKQPPSFMPFGCGKRVCIGEQLARNVLFLTAVNLLRKIQIRKADDFEYESGPDPNIGFAMQTLPYKVVVELRKK